MPSPDDKLTALQQRIAALHCQFATPYRVTEDRRTVVQRLLCITPSYTLWYENTKMMTSKRQALIDTIARLCNAAYQMGCDNILSQLDPTRPRQI